MTPLAAWQRFWFTPQPTAPTALFRIGFGLAVTAWTASLGPNLLAFLGPDGILPDAGPPLPGAWGLLGGAGTATVVALYAVTLLGGIALTLGLWSRLAAVVVFVGVVSLQHRNPLVLNSGDLVLRNLAFYCVLLPSGAALSLDRWRAARRSGADFWTFPDRAPWALRLVQIQVSLGYLAAVGNKVATEPWRDGTAVSYALRMVDFQRLPVPAGLTAAVLVTEVLTYGTVAAELALAVLVWNRAARPYVLALGVALHVGIDYAIVVGFFGVAMLVAYLAFVPPDTAARLVLAVRTGVRRRATTGRRTAVPVAGSGSLPDPAPRVASAPPGIGQGGGDGEVGRGRRTQRSQEERRGTRTDTA